MNRMFNFLTKIFDSNEKQLAKLQPIIEEINSREKAMSKLSDEQLKARTEHLRKGIGVNLETSRTDFTTLKDEELSKDLDLEKEKLYSILPEAFATVREASKRVANHRHFDVQLMAGYVLFDNKVAELFTGEGKPWLQIFHCICMR